MKQLINYITVMTIVSTWIAGIVIAKGAQTLFAICIPFYSWHLLIERVMQINGWLS